MDILIHRREAWRPTSTSRLLTRVLPAALGHVFSQDLPLDRNRIVRPDRTLWILHPAGDLPPSPVAPDSLQVLLLDGCWREASRMRRQVESWGRLIRLPPGKPSRYHLRNQHSEDRYSTAETLILLLETLGMPEVAVALRHQFDLHVYAGLRSRGAVVEAEDFLAGTALETSLPTVLRDLRQRRRCP